jgi:ubiquinone/menaquinone biosynthesis C-methylase UbiE
MAKAWNQNRKDQRNSILSSTIAPHLKAGSSLLDLSCGSGNLARLIKEKAQLSKVAGCDIVVYPKLQISDCTIYDGKVIPYSDNAFDYVLISDVLHHSPEPLALLKEAMRVAKERVILKDHLVHWPLDAFTLQLMDFLGNGIKGIPPRSHYKHYSEWENCFKELNVNFRCLNSKLHLYPRVLPGFVRDDLHVLFELSKESAI